MDKKEFKVGKLYCARIRSSIPEVRPFTILFDRFDQRIGEIWDMTFVIYIETGKTGDYKLMCGDFIGWTSQTLDCLEEISNKNGEEDTAVET